VNTHDTTTGPRRSTRRGLVVVIALVLTVGAVAAVTALLGGPEEEAPAAQGRQPTSSSEPPEPCLVDERLVNSCRPWFGGTANHYPEAVKWDKLDQLLGFERRTGRRLDVAHNYHDAGDNELSEADLHFAQRKATLALTSWKPTNDWSKGDGSDPAVDAGIDEMARSIRSLGDRRIFLTVFHEPENDLTSAPRGCAEDVPVTGKAGTAGEYRAMWRNVRERFDALGVDNVVWVMNYMGYHGFECMTDALYPGDDLVDWVLFNGYDQGDADVDFSEEVRGFYDHLTESSRPGHDYLSKPWGLAEWGIYDSTQRSAYEYYEQARRSLEAGEFPRLKMYLVFDSVDPNTGNGSYRVAFGADGNRDPREQRAFNAFANSPAITGAWRFDRQRGGRGR
jgi:hypothetical protein